MKTRTAPQPGDVRTLNFQSDVHGGQYRLIEHLGGGRWTVEDLPPSDATVESIIADAATAAARRAANPSGFGRMTEDDIWEMAEQNIADREARAGRRHTITLVSAAEWARYF
jgi:hypothetical protein